MPARLLWPIFTAIAIATGCASLPPRQPNTLSIDYSTLLALSREGKELDYETAWCLIGSVADTVVQVDGVAAPFISERNDSAVNFQGCNRFPNTVGWYHNHPPGNLSNCAVSEADMVTTNSWPNFLIAIISCDGDSFIYLFQGNTQHYRILPDHYLSPH